MVAYATSENTSVPALLYWALNCFRLAPLVLHDSAPQFALRSPPSAQEGALERSPSAEADAWDKPDQLATRLAVGMARWVCLLLQEELGGMQFMRPAFVPPLLSPKTRAEQYFMAET